MRRMTIIITMTFATAVSGCATPDKPSICDGRHRRPANPYGSVLSDTSSPAAKPPVDPASLSPCGSRP
jgi:hypothetical protein